MMVKMEEDTGRGITGSDITDQNILEIHAISDISASDEKYAPCWRKYRDGPSIKLVANSSSTELASMSLCI